MHADTLPRIRKEKANDEENEMMKWKAKKMTKVCGKNN